MNKIFLAVALMMSFVATAQNYTGDYMEARKRLKLRGTAIDTIKNDTTGLEGRTKTLLTADAIYKFVNGRTLGGGGSGGGGNGSLTMDSLRQFNLTWWGASVQWTTGNITSGSSTLTVAAIKDFQIGQWITVVGAATTDDALRAEITNIVGTTITLSASASVTVSNAKVRHDNTPAINAALSYIVATGGGTLIVPYDTAQYFISGPLQTSVNGTNPNCQIPIPLVQASSKMVSLKIMGSSTVNLSAEGADTTIVRNTQGVIFESTIRGSGTTPSVISTPWYNSGLAGNKNYLNLHIENLIVRTSTKIAGVDTAGLMSAIFLQRIIQLSMNNVKADISSDIARSKNQSNETYGIVMPGNLNKVELKYGHIFAEGYNSGIVLGGHASIQQLLIVGCVNGITTISSGGNIAILQSTIELTKNAIVVGGNSHLAIFSYEGEHYVDTVNVKWWQYEYDIKRLFGTGTVSIMTSTIGQTYSPNLVDVFQTTGSPVYNLLILNGNYQMPVGNGTANTLTKFTAAKVIGNSSITDDGMDINMGGKLLAGYNAKYRNETGTSYTLVASDAGKIITFNNAADITLTVSNGLPTGFTCTVIQLGAGEVVFTASSTTINNRQAFTKTAGQYAVAAITMYAPDTFITGGDLQ